MPKRNIPPPGSGKIVEAIKDLIKVFGGKSSFIARALKISPSYAGKIVKSVKEGKSSSSWIGFRNTKRGEENIKKFSKLIKKSKVIYRERRIEGKLKSSILPPPPKRSGKNAEVIRQHKTIKNKKTGKREAGKRVFKSVIIGDTKRTVYKYDPSRKIKIPKNADIQLIAHGKGISKGKIIYQTSSHVGDWVSAWNSLRENIERTHFNVHDIHVLVLENAPIRKI